MLSEIGFLLTILRAIKQHFLYSSSHSIESKSHIVHHGYLGEFSVLCFTDRNVFAHLFLLLFPRTRRLSNINDMHSNFLSELRPHSGDTFGFEYSSCPRDQEELNCLAMTFAVCLMKVLIILQI